MSARRAKKLLNLATTLFAVALAALMLTDIHHQYNETVRQEYQHLDKLARIADEHISGSLRAIDVLLRDIAQGAADMAPEETAILEAVMRQHSRNFPEVRSISVSDAVGRIVLSTRDDIKGFDASRRDYFLTPKAAPDKSSLFVFKPIIATTGVPVIFASRALPLRNGAWQGVVVGALSPDYFTSMLLSVLPENGGSVTLAGTNGDLYARVPQRDDLIGKSLNGVSHFMSHQLSGQRTSQVEAPAMKIGEPAAQTIFRTLAGGNLVVVVSRDTGEILRGWRQETAAKLAVLLLLIAAAIVVARKIVHHERDLHDAKEYAEQLLATANVMVIVRNAQGEVVVFNEAAEQLTGYDRAWIKGRNWFELAVPRDRYPRVWEEFGQFSPDVPLPRTFQCPIVTRNGGERIIAWRNSTLHQERQGITSVSFGVDLTERIDSERQMAALSERLSLAAKAGRIGVWDWDLISNQLVWDDRMFELYDVDRRSRESRYEMWRRSIYPGDLKRVEAEVAAAINGSDVLDTEFRLLNMDGCIRHIKAAATVQRDETGHAVRMTGVNWDITDIREAQIALDEARSQAERANRAKSEFVANMSHEIRTPLNAVLGLAHLLGRSALTKDQRECVEKITVAGQSLLGILNDILDFSKVEAGRMELEKTSFDLEDVLNGLTTIMAVTAASKNLEVLIGADPAVPRRLVGDPLRLQQILINLIGNAIKFTHQGEVVMRVTLARRNPSDVYLRFTVRDTGIGMTDEQMAGLFTPFTQADTSTTRRYGGSGLGLVISKRMAELMDGDIGADSIAGKGSTFWFTARFGLPAPETASPPSRHEMLHDLSVLVVDDNPTARDILSGTVESLKWRSECAPSGPEALARLTTSAAARYDVLLIDWQMPEMDGLATTRAIREEKAADGAPIVLMVTAHDREEVLKQPESRLIDGVLVKPLTASTLFNAVAEAKARQEGRGTPLGRPDGGRNICRLDGARLLLVEDNAINQDVARRILELEGAAVAIVDDGKQAVDVLRAGANFDAVLMDVQMPVMDGIEATRVIRSELKLDRLPIIALTAGALQSDRAQCRDAGMDGFIAKPFDVDQMITALQAAIHPDQPQTTPAPTPAAAPSGAPDGVLPVLDLRQALRRLGGDRALLAQLMERMLEQAASVLPAVRSDLEALEHTSAARRLHSLRGVAGNVGALALAETASAAEAALVDRRSDDIPALLAELQSRLEMLVPAVNAALAESDGAAPATLAAPPLNPVQLAELTGLLRESNMDAIRVATQYRNGLAALMGETRARAISDAIERLDFKTALTELDAFAHD